MAFSMCSTPHPPAPLNTVPQSQNGATMANTTTHTAACPFEALARIEALARRILETKHSAAETRELAEIITIAQELANDLDVAQESHH